MDREEAIRRIKAWNLDSGDREVLAVVIPELAESEDERIRKELLEEIESIIPHEDETDSEGLILPSYHTRIDRYKSYLEKQKDLDKMIVVSPEVWDKAISDAFENGKKDGEKQKEQKLVEINEYEIIKKHITEDDRNRQAYIKGYEQAEKDIIDYACYELEFRLPECLNYNGIQVERAEFIKDFRKAMEEE